MQLRVLIKLYYKWVIFKCLHVITALLQLETFNLMMLMSSFISLVFYCSKSFFFCFKNDLLNTYTLLIKSLSVFPSESVLTGFDCIEKLRWEHTIGNKLQLQQHITAIYRLGVYCQNLCFCIVETQYDEGPRDWQKLFTMRRFCYTEFLFHITRIKKIVCYTEDFVIYTVEV